MPGIYRLRRMKQQVRRHWLAASLIWRQVLCVGIVVLSWPTLAATEEQPPEVLNNLVTQLVDLADGDLMGKREIDFTVPQAGWCWFSLTGEARIRLNSEGEPIVAVNAATESDEAMRWLPAGRHHLQIDGQADQLAVRTVPELQYAFYDGGDLWTLAHGPYDWEFLSREVHPHINVMVSAAAPDPEHLREWKKQGRRWLMSSTVPGSGREDVTADEAYEFWAASEGLNNPLIDGILVDEFPGGDQLKYDAYREAVERISANAKFRGKSFSPYSCGGGGILSGFTGTDRCQQFARACLAGGGQIAIERYLVEQPTMELARSRIQEELTAGWNMPRFDQDFPGVVRQTVMVLGYMSAVGESLNIDPGVDYKVYLDMQMQTLATEPSYAGLGGIQFYHSGYADEETVRWAARLIRHYAIEGKTGLLSEKLDFEYRPEVLKNPDFTDGLDGWTVEPAEAGSVEAKSHDGYGYLQFRYAKDGIGDRFLWTKRSTQRPNAFHQELHNLVPGKLYSLKMVTSDFRDLCDGRSEETLHAVRIELEDVDLVSDKKSAFQQVFHSHYGRPSGAFAKGLTFPMNYHWRVFRAKARTAKLSVSDWKHAQEPGGPAGQELIYNFIEVQPYFEAETQKEGKRSKP